MGLLAGPQVVAGNMIGSAISGLQISMSSYVSGTIWTVVKKEISMGNLKDEDMNAIRSDSEWAKAAGVGNDVGKVMKDLVSSSIGVYIHYLCLMGISFGRLYSHIHS